ncbi:Trk system potassium uptake protein trkG [Porphyromonas crevioricanis]|uniref:Trk system potassium uptake protein trkG n=1 Tax=Porphyromonas crevioricanis TaxID=393921 RepID=A0A2X4PMH9_9PORP|nr:trk system potassium uptake protein TrkH [Porphyromonas crevioricanis]SQH73575.1 Trk system potassium uptake protein trkG [Porphyromonas crevioricanis]
MRHINFRFVLKTVGLACIMESGFLFLAIVIAFLYREEDLMPLIYTTLFMLGVGLVGWLSGFRTRLARLSRREGMLIVTLIWVVLSSIGMLPFWLGGYVGSISDAFFETMSGYTTTGATIFPSVEHLPHGILFWRSLLQWQGGIGIVVFTLALLPVITGDRGASTIYNAETTGIMHDRFLPRISTVSKRLALVYVVMTTLLFFLLWIGPMNSFDAVCHALTCISTGGYSTKDSSVAYYNSAYVEYVLSAFMFIASLSLTLIYFCFVGKPTKLLRDEEFRWYSILVLAAILITSLWLWAHWQNDSVEETIRTALFQVTSLISTTGYLTSDITQWQPFFWVIMLLLMFICGCSGSTSGGLKVSRFMVLVKNLRNEFKKRIHPNAVVPVKANGIVIPGALVSQVLAFFFAYLGLICVGVLLLTFDGIPFIESISASVSATGNVGPALGSLRSNFAEISPFSKWVLSFLMLAGRLEIFTVLSILRPAFWKE